MYDLKLEKAKIGLRGAVEHESVNERMPEIQQKTTVAPHLLSRPLVLLQVPITKKRELVQELSSSKIAREQAKYTLVDNTLLNHSSPNCSTKDCHLIIFLSQY